jgi:transcriptional regulator with XRE-family HTH domain
VKRVTASQSVDLVTLGQRLRHLRRAKGMTLEQLSAAVGRAPSQLSVIENGKREPKLSVLQALAGALGVPLQDLLRPEAPSRRAGLEIELAHLQKAPAYQALGLPAVRAGRRLPADALEALIGLHRELNRVLTEQSATPEVARRANAQLRVNMRERDNYFAAALLMPETFAVEFLRAAKADHALAIDDFRDAFGVSYETAAHRFTNLATHHFGIPVHFTRVHESGIVYKAYENDGVLFPADVTGAIEGQPVCRKWASREIFQAEDKYSSFYQFTDTSAGTYWCTVHTESTRSGEFSVTVGTPFEHARWFRGGDTTRRTVSRCPDPTCCRRPPADLVSRWSGHAWPSARVHSHLLAALPPGTFPGVDAQDVYEFLDRRA